MAGQIKIESFITVEQTMVNVIMRRWRKEGGTEAIHEVSRRANERDFDGARAVANRLNFDSVIDQIDQIELVGMAAILFGESLFAGGRLGPKGVGEIDGRTDLLTTAAQALAQGLQFNGTRLLQEEVRAMVDSVEQEVDPVTRVGEVMKVDVLKVADLGLAAQLNASVAKGATRVVETSANLTTSRLASLGAMDQAGVAGAKRYQINEILDEAICPICRRMHGRVFEVAGARDSLIGQLSIQNPQELATASPFPNQSRAGVKDFTGMNSGQLSAAGWDRPPFHPGCRGVIVPVGSVPRGQKVPFRPLRSDMTVQEQTLRSVGKPVPKKVKPVKAKPKKPVPKKPVEAKVPEKLAKQSRSLEESLAGRPHPHQAIDDINQLYLDAAVADKELAALTRKLAKRLEGEAVFAPADPVTGSRLKGIKRATEKATIDLGGDFGGLTDLSRASLEFDKIDDVYQALDALRKTKGVRIVRFNDRFANPTAEGYRDMIMNLEMSNGHVVELQLHVKSILRVKNDTHIFYERQGEIVRAAKKAKRDLTLAETEELQELVLKQQKIYGDAFLLAL